MTDPQIIFAAVVFLIGMPAAVAVRLRWFPVTLRNLTAAALVLAYFAVEALYRMFGRVLEPQELVCIDMTVIALIYLKPPAHVCYPYRSRWDQLCAFWFELSVWDRAVLGIFPLVWMTYAFAPTPHFEWWALWTLSLAQFFAAGAESMTTWLSARAANAGKADTPDIPSSGVEFAMTTGWRGYG